jgi:CRISPR-associated protein Cmr3
MNDNNNINNNSAYRNVCVTLIPLGNFFFGGQKLTEVEKEKDYYIKSLYYPQQTVILGMLRYELLVQNELFPLDSEEKKEKAARLIGESSFAAGNIHQEFGAIEELSPVFIKRKDDRIFHVLPKDYGHTYTPDKKGKTFFNHPETVSKEFLPYFERYDAKEENPEKLVSKEFPHHPFELSKIFIPDEQIGIKKGKSGQTEEEAYYKQVFFRLKKEYAFSFYLRLKTNIDGNSVNFKGNFVFIGGDRSGFRMEVKDTENQDKSICDLFDETLPEFKDPKIVLTGDAFVRPEILNICDCSVSGSVFFRNFRSFVRTTHKYWNLTNQKEDKETPFLGDRYNLLSRGTILYYGNNPETLKRLTRLLDEQGNKKIGFNYYKIYPSQKEKGKE